jgi:addiction module HigA family antidote
MKTLRDLKRRPTHPGEILREDLLPALGITQGEFAKRLGVSRLTVSELLREKRAVSPDMALRLARLLNTTPESWLNMQQAVDLWKLGGARTGRYARIKPVKPLVKKAA